MSVCIGLYPSTCQGRGERGEGPGGFPKEERDKTSFFVGSPRSEGHQHRGGGWHWVGGLVSRWSWALG